PPANRRRADPYHRPADVPATSAVHHLTGCRLNGHVPTRASLRFECSYVVLLTSQYHVGGHDGFAALPSGARSDSGLFLNLHRARCAHYGAGWCRIQADSLHGLLLHEPCPGVGVGLEEFQELIRDFLATALAGVDAVAGQVRALPDQAIALARRG